METVKRASLSGVNLILLAEEQAVDRAILPLGGHKLQSLEQVVIRREAAKRLIGRFRVGRSLIAWKQAKTYRRFDRLRLCVSSTIDAIQSLSQQQCSNIAFLEKEFIPSLGLNDEGLNEQPKELAEYFGLGLHLWQYPSQLAGYLAWLSNNAKDIKCYAEIGCRWGGMLILVTEWLRKNGANLQKIVAVDPIRPTPFVEEYFNFLNNERASGRRNVEALYLQEFSTSHKVKRIVNEIKPDFVFIDGDHSLKGALLDHLMVRDFARVIVHHDVSSDSCTETTLLWNVLKKFENHEFNFFEFVEQYASLGGQRFLGIGVMKRKMT
jgi:cephalosporin hydroxylase